MICHNYYYVFMTVNPARASIAIMPERAGQPIREGRDTHTSSNGTYSREVRLQLSEQVVMPQRNPTTWIGLHYATFVDLFEAARKIVCIPGDESERHDLSLSRPTVRTGSRGYDRWVVTTSRSTYGDGRHNRGLIALFVVIIHSCSAARGRRSLCARRFCGRMRSCSKN
jgi:hypothetical protein